VERNLAKAASELGFRDLRAFAERLLKGRLTRNETDVLVSHLTVGETYFFRDRKLFRVLEQYALPELIGMRRETGKSLRIWSAGCCTGEEPYSAAILLCKLLPDIEHWNASVLATDINRQFLRVAAEGQYGLWSFRDDPIDAAFFRPVRKSRYEIRRTAKSLVTFSYLNLMKDVYPALVNGTNGLDIIFCRNVLMYFKPDCARKVIRRLYASLADGGWLIVSPSEMSHDLFHPLSAVQIDGALLYRKARPEAKAGVDPMHRAGILRRGAHPVESASSSRLNPDAPTPAPAHRRTREAGLAARGTRTMEPVAVSTYERAYALYVTGEYDGAYELLCETLTENRGSTPSTFQLLVRICANQAKLDEALEWCGMAIESDRLNPAIYYLQAAISRELGQLDLARIALRQVLYLDHRFVVAHIALADLARTQGMHAEAVKHCRHALALLANRDPEAIVPESDGMTAGQLRRTLETAQVKPKVTQ
jgi:chemotaxis protein methyltransferase CheR